MILHNRKACIKSIKTNPLAQKIKDKQECTLRNCRVKTHYSTEILERNSF
jgi:hypothetical protein